MHQLRYHVEETDQPLPLNSKIKYIIIYCLVYRDCFVFTSSFVGFGGSLAMVFALKRGSSFRIGTDLAIDPLSLLLESKMVAMRYGM